MAVAVLPSKLSESASSHKVLASLLLHRSPIKERVDPILESHAAFENLNREAFDRSPIKLLIAAQGSPSEKEVDSLSEKDVGSWKRQLDYQKPKSEIQQNRFKDRNQSFLATSRSYYFTAFPQYWSRADMFETFSTYGKVIDLHLPRNPDRLGRMYDFVRFPPSINPRLLLLQLNGIWIGIFKLQVHLAIVENGSDVKAVPSSSLPLSDLVPETDKIQCHLAPDSALWLETCLIGFPQYILNIKSMNMILQLTGYIECFAVRINGGEVLIRIPNSEQQLLLLLDRNTLSRLGLNGVRPWKLFRGKSARIAWVRVRGIPIQYWADGLFKSLADNLGELIMLDEHTKSRTEMVCGRMQTLTNVRNWIHKSILVETERGYFSVSVTQKRHFETF